MCLVMILFISGCKRETLRGRNCDQMKNSNFQGDFINLGEKGKREGGGGVINKFRWMPGTIVHSERPALL